MGKKQGEEGTQKFMQFLSSKAFISVSAFQLSSVILQIKQ
jgi:hypothetical protein